MRTDGLVEMVQHQVEGDQEVTAPEQREIVFSFVWGDVDYISEILKGANVKISRFCLVRHTLK